MPELPEVEVVRRTLKNYILNYRIESIEVRYEKIIEGSLDDFLAAVEKQQIIDIERYGKYLIFQLQDTAFLSHLRMEGKYNLKDRDEPYDKHDHVIFHLDHHLDLRYNDTRKFGRMALCQKDYRQDMALRKLGAEPWDASWQDIYAILHRKKLLIKQVLLDQSLLVGIGNIYANEICFRMHLDPRTRVNRLSKKRTRELIEVSCDVLNQAIAQGGTTIHSFDANGIHGRFQVELYVHGQKVCRVCGTPIKKIVIGGRGTYYCPVCQTRRY